MVKQFNFIFKSDVCVISSIYFDEINQTLPLPNFKLVRLLLVYIAPCVVFFNDTG